MECSDVYVGSYGALCLPLGQCVLDTSVSDMCYLQEGTIIETISVSLNVSG